MKRLNFAIVGCGRIAAQKHAPVLAGELEEAELVAVCDVKPERARQMGERYGVPFYTDFHEMLKENSGIDVVNICTESGNHGRHAVSLARHGKHLVVEKPMALALSDAQAMREACRKNGCRLFVVQQNRCNPPVMKLREAIRKGRFGRIFLATARVRWCRHQDYYDRDAWRGTWALDGGVFAQQANHYLDALEWLAGGVKSVFARSVNAFASIEAEDTGTVSLTFRNGALGMIEATTAARPSDIEGSISILGSRGTAEVGGFALNEIRQWSFEEKLPGDESIREICSTSPPTVYGFGHYQYLKDVIDAIVNRRRAPVGGAEGEKALRLLHAVYASIEKGREVFLDDLPVSRRLGRRR